MGKFNLTKTKSWGLKIDQVLDLNISDEININKAENQIKEFENEMNLQLVTSIYIKIDWEFTYIDLFKQKDEIQRRNMILDFSSVIKKGLFEKEKGLIPYLLSLEEGKQEFIQKVKRIVIKYEKIQTYYEMEYSNQTLYILVNENYTSQVGGWGEKVEKCLDLNIRNKIYVNQTLKKIKEIEESFNQEFSSFIELKVDYSFIDDNQFKLQDEIQRRNMILAFEKVYEKGLNQKENGLKENLKLSQRGLKKFLSMVNIMKLVPKESNQVDTNDNYYIVKYDKSLKTLFFNIKKTHLDITDGFFKKVENELDLLIREECYIREVENRINEIENELKTKNIDICIEVSWDFLIDSPDFKKKDERDKRNLIYSVKRAIETGFYDKEKGIVKYSEISNRFGIILQNKVKLIVISLVPSSNVIPKFGNNFYSVNLSEPNLHIDISQNYCYNIDGWGYKIDRELDIHAKEELEMKKVEEYVNSYEIKLCETLGKTIYLEINWNGLINEKWKLQDDIYKRNSFYYSQKIIEKGKLIEILNNNENLKSLFQKNVGKILIEFDQNRIEDYFSIDFDKGILIIKIYVNMMEATQEWSEKIKKIIEKIESYNGRDSIEKSDKFEFLIKPNLNFKYHNLNKEIKCRLLKDYINEDKIIKSIEKIDKIQEKDMRIENSKSVEIVKESNEIKIEKKKIFEQIKEKRKELENKSLKSLTNIENSPLKKYMMIKKLGQGSFGKVYLCKKKEELVALKEMVCEKIDDSNMYLNEFLKGIKLSHPNIVQYNHVFNIIDEEDDDNFKVFIEMKYYSLGDLDHFIKDIEIDEETIIDFSIQILNGIEFIHEQNFVHRDLKPANIVLNLEKDEIHLAICDFGSTKAQGSLRAGSIAGTLNFVAPEVMTESEYSEKSDIFSFGAIFYYLLTKKEKSFYALILKNSMNDVKDEVSKLKYKSIKDFEEIVFSCLENDEKKRPSAKELKKKFQDIKQKL